MNNVPKGKGVVDTKEHVQKLGGVALTQLQRQVSVLLANCGCLLKNEDGQNRTLYSLRHNHTTFELLRGCTDIHTLSKQMGNSAAMIERHYSKLTATMAADRLA